MRRISVVLGLSVAAFLGGASTPVCVAAETTKAQQLRAKVSKEDLQEIRGEMSKMRSENRWPKEQQERYLKACEKASAKEPSINRRTCECQLEVMMEKYATLGDQAKALVNGGGKADEQTSTLFGFCLVAFGE